MSPLTTRRRSPHTALLAVPNSYANAWGDFDNDGDLDVYATDRAGDNTLFRNDGGTFTRVFAGVGPTDGRPTVGACWFDMDKDGDLDLFLANQSGASDALWRNDGKSFTDVAQALGVGVDNHAVGADWGDYDNDGDLDLSVISYEGPSGAQVPANALFRNDGAAGFTNVMAKTSPLNVADHGVQFVDYDNDGGLDLTVTDGYGPVGGHFVFRNTLPAAARKRSLSVLVLDAAGHQTRFGAEVRLYDPSGTLLASRQVVTGSGYNTQRAAPVHFGLARSQRVDVRVTFMGTDGPLVVTVI
ncbi:MAG: CRTAC1 family protein, partial [Gemmatimonadaceae bacterium]